ncbi:MAG: RNA 2',3'-cyclic phosphodiesterase [Pyrinomonadaceae bacterium]
MATKRIFAAVDISDEAKTCVGEYVQELRERFADLRVRWERSEKLHVTVHFAGDLDDGELASFEERVAAAAVTTEPFVIAIDGTGAFAKRRSRANVLWLGLGSHGELEKLAASLADDDSRFHAHLTIARLKDANRCRDLIDKHLGGQFGRIGFNATEIAIYESTLTAAGSVYTVVSKHPLSKS